MAFTGSQIIYTIGPARDFADAFVKVSKSPLETARNSKRSLKSL